LCKVCNSAENVDNTDKVIMKKFWNAGGPDLKTTDVGKEQFQALVEKLQNESMEH